MDRTDYKILNILQKDSTKTLKQIGNDVGLTAPAVSDRIRRMEESNVIASKHIDINREKLGFSIMGFILVACSAKTYTEFCDFCEKNPYIISHYHNIGVYNALLRFSVKHASQLDDLLAEIKKHGESQTSVQLSTYFETKDLILPKE